MKIIKKYLLQIVRNDLIQLFHPSLYPIIEVLFTHTLALVLFVGHYKLRNYSVLEQLFSDIICEELLKCL